MYNLLPDTHFIAFTKITCRLNKDAEWQLKKKK